MKLYLTVKPNAKQNIVEKIDETHYRVTVKAPPAENQANLAVIKVMALYLKVPQSRIEIVRGLQGKQKVLAVQ